MQTAPLWRIIGAMTEKVSVNLRLPPDLHAALREASRDEDRSLNNLIVHVLREWTEQRAARTSESRKLKG